MSTYAGVALSRVAGGAPFSLTLVSGEQVNQPILAETTTDILSGDSPNVIIKSISDLTGNAGFAIALPIAVVGELKSGFRDENMVPLGHDTAFIELNPFEFTPDSGFINVLFLDITPGQAAAELTSAELDGEWFIWFTTQEEKTVIPEASIETLSTHDIMVKLVVPTVPKSTKLDQIAILRAEGEDSELESALKTLFPSARVKWVTLTDLSRGAALWIHRRPPPGPDSQPVCTLEFTSVPVGIMLANGLIATLVRPSTTLPTSKTMVLTTSHDNQTTATLQFFNGRTSCGQVVLKGITPKPKGAVRIQASIEIAWDGMTTVTVEELDSTNKKVAELVSVLGFCTSKEMDEFVRQERAGENAPFYYDGPEMGELPFSFPEARLGRHPWCPNFIRKLLVRASGKTGPLAPY